MFKLRNEVEEVLVCFTKHGNYDLSGWIKENLTGVRYFNEPEDDHTQDWRSRATNLMIDNAKGDWILSLEEDFFITDYPHFFGKVRQAMENHDVITFPEDQRYHPAFLLVRTDLLKRTKRDFSVMGDGRDHYHQITKELKGLDARTTYLEDLGLRKVLDWDHMQGLTDNYFAPKPYFKLNEFHLYNQDCKRIHPMSDYWTGEMARCSNTNQ
jgi:hypothetical protein